MKEIGIDSSMARGEDEAGKEQLYGVEPVCELDSVKIRFQRHDTPLMLPVH